MTNVVKQEITFSDRPRRTLDEKLAALMPALGWRLFALILRLAPSSPVRRRVVALLTRRGYASLNRRDLDLNARTLYGPGSELVMKGDVLIGRGPFRGGEAIIDAYSRWQEVWADQRRVPEVLYDLGDRLVVVLDDSGRGPGSGIRMSRRFTDVVTMRDGYILLHEVYPDWEEGMRAAGLEGEIPSLQEE